MVNEPMTDERLAEIRAREQAATKGPWGPHEMPPLSEHHEWMEIGPYPAEPVAEVDCCNGPNWRNDAEFIGHSRQDIPDLLAEVSRLRAIEAELLKDKARLDAILAGWESGGHYDMGLTLQNNVSIACAPEFTANTWSSEPPRRWLIMLPHPGRGVRSSDHIMHPVGHGREAIDAALEFSKEQSC